MLSRCSQPILADEIQTFKALITIHKVLQEGHPITVREAQANTTWLESLKRSVTGDGDRGEMCFQSTASALERFLRDKLTLDRIWPNSAGVCIFLRSQALFP